MNKKNNKNYTQSEIMLDGMMVFGKLENGLRTADFECCEDVEMEPFVGNCRVQMMRDGNVYITELPKRVRNKSIFREDNSSLSRGQNRRFYFVFSLPEDEIERLPEKLVNQASAIAGKVMRELLDI
ncbi:MAG: hypothetical protein IKQ03_00575 [Prevotella sp.]|nr:hypothetical protein [Prevotella sp.]